MFKVNHIKNINSQKNNSNVRRMFKQNFTEFNIIIINKTHLNKLPCIYSSKFRY